MRNGLLARVAVVAWLGALAASGCANDGAIIPDTTKVLDGSTLAALISVTDDELRFSAETPQLASLFPGDVLVASTSDNTPYGLLRKLVAKRTEQQEVVLSTSPAKLEDAIYKGKVRLTRTLTEADLVSGMPEGLSVKGGEAGLVIGFNEVALDGAGDVLASGSLTIAPSIDLTIEIDLGGINELSFGLSVEQGASLELLANDGASLNQEVTIGPPLIFGSYVVEVATVPVVLTPVMTFFVGASGEVTASLSSNISQSSSYSLGLGYKDGAFGPIQTSSFNSIFDPPQVKDHASAKLYAGPELEVLVYGAVGPFVKADAYLRANASFGGSPPCLMWDLRGGLEAVIGVDFILSYETQILDVSEQLADSDGCASESPPATWSKTLGGSNREGVHSIQQTSEGGFIMAGRSLSFIQATDATWVVKLDAGGNILWQKAYGNIEQPSGIRQTSDGGYLVSSGRAGVTSNIAYFTRLDPYGHVVWAKAYQSMDGRGLMPHALRLHADGSFTVAGALGYFGDGGKAWVAKFAQDGTPLWSKQYGGGGWDRANDLLVDGDGSYIVAGTSTSYGGSAGDFWALKLGANGEIVWQRVYGGDSVEVGYGITTYGSAGYLMVGSSISFQNPESTEDDFEDALVVRLGLDGALAAVTNLDAQTTVDAGYDILETSDGGHVVAGFSGLTNSNLWLFKVGGSGKWTKLYGGSATDVPGGNPGSAFEGIGDLLLETVDGNLVVGGSTDSFGNDYQAWVMQVTQTGAIDFNPSSPAFDVNAGGSFDNPVAHTFTTSAVALDAPLIGATVPAEVVTVITASTAEQQAP